MTEHSNDLKSRLVTGFERDGRRRRFDPQAKLELVQACMQPGVSVAGMALEHAVNANLLRKWISELPSVFRLPEARGYAAVSFVR
jgi:transposase